MGRPWYWWLPFGWGIPSIGRHELARRLGLQSGDGATGAASAASAAGAGTPTEPILLVDVRRHGEYAGGHIPGAVNVPITEMSRHLDAVVEAARALGKDGRPCEVICICLTAHRSIPAVRLLHERNVRARQLNYGMVRGPAPACSRPAAWLITLPTGRRRRSPGTLPATRRCKR